MDLSKAEDIEDPDAVRELGQGWVAEETLAIAIYCSMKYSEDFDKALIASVNHSGDSDSTGAVTGNIVGAYLGLKGIPKKYLDNLELREVICKVAAPKLQMTCITTCPLQFFLILWYNNKYSMCILKNG